MKCEIIRDLLPSYIDELTSDASNQEIEKHLDTCEECRDYLSSMKKELPAEEIKRNKKNIKPFHKLKKVTLIAVLVTFLVCFALELLSVYYFGEETASTKDFVMEYEKVNDVVTLEFIPKKDNMIINVLSMMEPKESDEYQEVEITRHRDNPLRRSLRRSGYFGFTFIDENTILDMETGKEVELTGKENLFINCTDEKIIIPIKELYTAEGAAKYGILETD